MTSYLLRLLVCLLIAAPASAQTLQQVNKWRTKADNYFKTGKYESAADYFSKITKSNIYADATDYLQLASCHLHMRNNEEFKKNLIISIETGGADTPIIFTYFRSNSTKGHKHLNRFLKDNFEHYRTRFLSKTDTGMQRELDDILYLDQLPRTQGMSKENFPHVKPIGRYVDSVNYLRVKSLIERDKFPGFHNYGIMASKYDVVLMHITDHAEDKWEYIFAFLKKQVREGNITPKQVISIATRHYGNKQNCTYYGTVKKWGAKTLCNCAEVDNYRAEIGLETLAEEYIRLGELIPDCYMKK